MPAYFVDSSALLKRYVAETGSAWLKTLVSPASGNLIYIARVTVVEVIAALARRAKSGSLTPADAHAAIISFRRSVSGEYVVLDMGTPLLDRAADIAETRTLRGYDAVQLAAALEANDARVAQGADPLVLVSADSELNAAAVAEGLTVEDPNAHP